MRNYKAMYFEGNQLIGVGDLKEHKSNHDYLVAPRNIAYFCGYCSDVWARVVVERDSWQRMSDALGAGLHSAGDAWDIQQVACPKCDDGSYKRRAVFCAPVRIQMIIDEIPNTVLWRDFFYLWEFKTRSCSTSEPAPIK